MFSCFAILPSFLNLLFRRIERNGKPYILRLSRQPPNRDELMELSKNFEEKLKKRQVKMQGYCPIRRELYDQLFGKLFYNNHTKNIIACAINSFMPHVPRWENFKF